MSKRNSSRKKLYPQYSSVWNGKIIELEKFNGSKLEYLRANDEALEGINYVTNHFSNCVLNRIPRILIAERQMYDGARKEKVKKKEGVQLLKKNSSTTIIRGFTYPYTKAGRKMLLKKQFDEDPSCAEPKGYLKEYYQ